MTLFPHCVAFVAHLLSVQTYFFKQISVAYQPDMEKHVDRVNHRGWCKNTLVDIQVVGRLKTLPILEPIFHLFIQLVGRVKTRQAQTAAIYHLRNPPLDNSKISSEPTPQINVFIFSQSFSYLFFIYFLIYRGVIITSQQILCSSAKRTIWSLRLIQLPPKTINW